MIPKVTRTLSLLFGCCLVLAGLPGVLRAQLVRENVASAGSRSSPSSTSSATATGKERVSQEVQLNGDAGWIDTGIDVQAGEHVVFTASGKLRYANAKTDNT